MPMHVRASLPSVAMVVWCFAIMLLPVSAIAGPPFRTDDPEPVPYQHWEFYTFSAGTHVRGDTSGVGPGFEYNYGLIPNGQLHIVAPAALPVARRCSAPAIQKWASNTGSSKKTRTAHDPWSAYFRCLSCRPEVSPAV